jgi:hypothetical protein
MSDLRLQAERRDTDQQVDTYLVRISVRRMLRPKVSEVVLLALAGGVVALAAGVSLATGAEGHIFTSVHGSSGTAKIFAPPGCAESQ